MPPARFERLDAWCLSHQLAIDLSRLCRTFPAEERFELAAQLRRAARSVPANLAEGVGSQSRATFLRHIWIALGSIAEVENHLICARDEGYITTEACAQFRDRIWKVKGLIVMLARRLKASQDKYDR